MTNQELQDILKKFPSEAELWSHCDGVNPYEEEGWINLEVSYYDFWKEGDIKTGIPYDDTNISADQVKTIIL